jgi:glycosyltransferase involved in cell wall biosynthesis
MRVVYVGKTSYLEPGLSLVGALASYADVAYLLWVAPESWGSTLLGETHVPIGSSVHNGRDLLRQMLPQECEAYWGACRETYVVEIPSKKSTDPRSLVATCRVFDFIRRLRPDVVHLEDPGGLRMALGAGRIAHPALVLDVHDPAPHSNVRTWKYRAYRRALFPQVDRFVLHNRCQMEDFCQEFSIPLSRTDSVPLGAYEILTRAAVRESPARSRRPTVLFFGSLAFYKGVDVLLRSAESLKALVPNVRIIVAARSGSRRPPRPSGMCDAVDWRVRTHYFSPEETAALYSEADVVVLPYLSATQSGVLLSAYAFGKPVVASRVGGLPEYIDDGETGILVEPGDPKELASALGRVLNDRRLYARMAGAITRAVKGQLSWETAVEQYLEVYDRALTNRGRR